MNSSVTALPVNPRCCSRGPIVAELPCIALTMPQQYGQPDARNGRSVLGSGAARAVYRWR